jgi:hypothetical protein
MPVSASIARALFAGMPLARQLQTVANDSFSAEAIAFMLPAFAMTSSNGLSIHTW